MTGPFHSYGPSRNWPKMCARCGDGLHMLCRMQGVDMDGHQVIVMTGLCKPCLEQAKIDNARASWRRSQSW